MRLTPLSLLMLALATGSTLGQKAELKNKPVDVSVQKGLVVHEWGVFSAHDDLEMANAEMKAEWDSLPKFIYGQMAGRKLPDFYGNYVVRKPVVFFHAPETIAMEMRVDFPQGMPVVWWPRTSRPTLTRGARDPDAKPGEPFHYLRWDFFVKQNAADVKMLTVPKDHWVSALRNVEADEVLCNSERNLNGRLRPGRYREQAEREKFIYYDGVIPNPAAIDLTALMDKEMARSRVKFPLFDLTVVDRRSRDHVRIGRIDKLDALAKERPLRWTEQKAADWQDDAAKALVGQLKKADLFEDEANALVEIWKKDLFQAEGLTCFYRIPQEEYDRLLPVTLKPRPEKLVRIGLVHQRITDPSIAEKVAQLVKRMDDDSFPVREKAQEDLERMGRKAYSALKRLQKSPQSAEVKRRLDAVLAVYDLGVH
ncbi:MAG TPA: hypothetical protein VGZ25_08675 [Gemmataceae bacterium]|nr:hypothetical protein [Gemmataceae bacterium]